MTAGPRVGAGHGAGPVRAAGPLPRGSDDISQLRLSRILAVGALVLTGMRFEIAQGVTTGHLAAVALLPLWWPALARYRGARVIVWTGLAAAAGGLWLTWLASADHSVSRGVLVQSVALLLSVVLGIGVVAWARTLLKDWQVGLAFGVGLALAISPGTGQFDVNPWKFGFAVPTAVVLLSLAARTGRRGVEVVALLALAGVSAVNDARSGFAILALAAVVTGSQWLLRPRAGGGRSRLAILALFAALGLAVYNLGLALVLDGRLGEEAQRRSAEQIATGGSVILGGRPEIAATLALMEHRPWGLGPGVAATLDEILVAKTGMAGINYDPNNGYVETYMFGPRTTLHSVVGDVWVLFGIPGLVFLGVLLWVLVRDLAHRLGTGTASGLAVYASCLSLWNLAFGPLSTSAPMLVLAVGLVLLRQQDQRPAAAGWVASRQGLPASPR